MKQKKFVQLIIKKKKLCENSELNLSNICTKLIFGKQIFFFKQQQKTFQMQIGN